MSLLCNLDDNATTIYKGSTVIFTATENYVGQRTSALNASTPQQYQLIDNIVDIKINNLISKNPLIIRLEDIVESSTAGTYTGKIARNDNLAEAVKLLQGQEITLVKPDDAAGSDQIAITINLSDDITLVNNSGQSQDIKFTIPNNIDREALNDLNDGKLEASLKSYEAFFNIGSNNLENSIVPEGSRLRFAQDSPLQNCTPNPSPAAEPFSLVLVDELPVGSDMATAGITVIDFSEAQRDLSQNLSNPIAHYQLPDSDETAQTSSSRSLKIIDRHNALIKYTEIDDGEFVPVQPANPIQLQENGVSQTRYIELSSQPTEGVTIYLETNDTSEVAIQKDYNYIDNVKMDEIDSNSYRLRTRKPPKTSNEDFLQEAILKMDSNRRIKGFTVTYENNNENGDIREIKYITTNNYKVKKVDDNSSGSFRLFANSSKLQSIRDELDLVIVDEQFSPESLVAFTFTPDNWQSRQPLP